MRGVPARGEDALSVSTTVARSGPHPGLARRWVERALLVGLAALALLFQAKGFSLLTTGTDAGDAVDLQLRWCEEHYFVRGYNPFDVWLAHAKVAAPARPSSPTRRPSSIEPELGVCPPAHPPWGYISGLLFFLPPWPMVRWYF